ncbi:MAG: hypothetical protein L0Y54_07535 [Sporichthyaceae bacterium]|nr:hypothetical protein [Sporichthyaceae bacterium]
MTRLPDTLPVLASGRHLDPIDGGCLMELASVLAGERWSDSPRCTHPVLAAVARLVNDATSDQARPRLAQLVPDLAGAVGDARTTAPELVIRCAQAALRFEPAAVQPRRAANRAAGRLAKVTRASRASRGSARSGPRWPILEPVGNWIYTYGPATQTVARTLDAIMRSAPDPDRALAELLADCLAATLRPCQPSRRSSSVWTSSTRRAGPSPGTPSASSAVTPALR